MSASSPHPRRWPAEWEPHACTWMSWPLRRELWSGRHSKVEALWARIALAIARDEELRIFAAAPDSAADHAFPNDVPRSAAVLDRVAPWEPAPFSSVRALLHEQAARENAESALQRIRLYAAPVDDVWIRDYGPLKVKRLPAAQGATPEGPARESALFLKFRFNGWGGKYEPHANDDRAGLLAAQAHLAEEPGAAALETHEFYLEGGAVEGDGGGPGAGVVLTTESCVLNPNRHPEARKRDLDALLRESLGARHVLWLPRGLPGDDTDGHIDMIARFTAAGRMIASLPEDRSHPAHGILKSNLRILESFRNFAGERLEVEPLPHPSQVYAAGAPVARTHANFCLTNGSVLVPVFGESTDDLACHILERHFPDRRIVPIDANDMFLEGGGPHCMTMQIPK